MSAAFHRAVSVDTRVSVAIAEIRVGMRLDPALLERLGIEGELLAVVATLEQHLQLIREELRRLTDDPYPQQPGEVP